METKQKESPAIQKIRNQAAKMNTITVFGRQHVIRPVPSRGETKDIETGKIIIRDADYRGTGLAWAGTLRKNETLQEFQERWINLKISHIR